MGSSPTVKLYPAFVGISLSMAFLLLLLLSGSPSVARAADYTVIGGIVERVSGTIVTTVEGNRYDVERARVVAPSGKEIPFSEIARGKKVSLFMSRNNRITTVVVYPSMVE